MQTYEPMAGEHIRKAAALAIALAGDHGEPVRFTFNDQEIVVTRGDDPDKVAAAYSAEQERRAEAYRNSPEGRAAAERREEANRRADAAKAEGILPFTVRDREGWDKTVAANDDDYGAAAIRYAARWANLMEKRMGEGHTLRDCADKASQEADAEVISGFMYGCAVSILAQVWEHGEELRRWHNLKSQVGDEGEKANESGGVLNPAMLRID